MYALLKPRENDIKRILKIHSVAQKLTGLQQTSTDAIQEESNKLFMD